LRSPSVKALQRKAQSERSRGKYESAQRLLAEAMRLSATGLADLHGTLGGILREQGLLAQAAGEYDQG